MIEWILQNKEWLGGLVLGFFSFLTGRKTAKNQEESGELENLKTVREVEKSLINDIKDSITGYKKIIDENEIVIANLKTIVSNQKKAIEKQKKIIADLNNQLNKLLK